MIKHFSKVDCLYIERNFLYFYCDEKRNFAIATQLSLNEKCKISCCLSKTCSFFAIKISRELKFNFSNRKKFLIDSFRFSLLLTIEISKRRQMRICFLLTFFTSFTCLMLYFFQRRFRVNISIYSAFYRNESLRDYKRILWFFHFLYFPNNTKGIS